MAISFVSTANSGTLDNATSTASFSFNNTGNCITAVFTACEDLSYVQVDTSTKPRFGTTGGDANDGRFTFVCRGENGSSNTGWVEIWVLKNAPSGNLTFTAQLTGNVNYSWQVTLQSWSGVDTSTPIDATGTGDVQNGDTPTASVTTSSDNAWLVSGFVDYNIETISGNGGNQTEDTAITDAGNGTQHYVSHKGPNTPAGSYSIILHLGTSAPYVTIAAALKPDAGGGGAVQQTWHAYSV